MDHDGDFMDQTAKFILITKRNILLIHHFKYKNVYIIGSHIRN